MTSVKVSCRTDADRHRALGAGRPLVIAHRGGAALAPENTLPAFDRASALGVDALELDVRLSRDGIPVVVHDATLDRTTNARGPVAARTADELARVDAAYHFSSGGGHPFRGQGIGIPRLRDVLGRHPDVPLTIDLKLGTPVLAHLVVDELRRAGALDRVCVGSFRWRVLRRVRLLEPAIPTSAAREETRWALYRSWIGWPLRRPRYRAFQVPELAGGTRIISPAFVRMAHACGLVVQVWTVNRQDDMRRLLGWGVDGLISDRPDVALDVVRAFRQTA